MLGLLAGQRALFAPELARLYPQLVAAIAHPIIFVQWKIDILFNICE
jgi:hypothetical protein